MNVEIKFHLERKFCFPCAQFMLRKCIGITNLSVSVEAEYWVLTFNERDDKSYQNWPWVHTFVTQNWCDRVPEKRIFAVSEMRHSQSSPRSKLHCCTNHLYTEYISRYKISAVNEARDKSRAWQKPCPIVWAGQVFCRASRFRRSLARQANAVGNFHGSFDCWLDFGLVQSSFRQVELKCRLTKGQASLRHSRN